MNVSAIEAAPDKDVRGDRSGEGVEMADGKALQRAFMGTGKQQPLAMVKNAAD